MRIRTIKPEFWEDELIGSIPRDARLLFIATWNIADDEGLLRWSPEFIKAAAFVYDDDVDTAALMKDLEDAGLVVSYVGGRTNQRLGWIPTFLRHQRVNRPQPSKLPPPSLQNPKVRLAYADRDRWVCQICCEEMARASGNVYDGEPSVRSVFSLDHIESQLVGGSDYPSNIRAVHQGCNASRGSRPDSVNGSRNDSRLEGKGKGTGNGRERYAHGFDAFWAVYPLKKAKDAAYKAWLKALERAPAEVIVAGAERYRDDPGRTTRYTKYAQGWLNDSRWTDEPTPVANEHVASVQRVSARVRALTNGRAS